MCWLIIPISCSSSNKVFVNKVCIICVAWRRHRCQSLTNEWRTIICSDEGDLGFEPWSIAWGSSGLTHWASHQTPQSWDWQDNKFFPICTKWIKFWEEFSCPNMDLNRCLPHQWRQSNPLSQRTYLSEGTPGVQVTVFRHREIKFREHANWADRESNPGLLDDRRQRSNPLSHLDSMTNFSINFVLVLKAVLPHQSQQPDPPSYLLCTGYQGMPCMSWVTALTNKNNIVIVLLQIKIDKGKTLF